MAKRRNSSAKPASDDHVETDTATTAQVGSAGEAASALEAATAVDPEKQTDAPAAGQEPGAPAPAPDCADAESQGATETEALSDGQEAGEGSAPGDDAAAQGGGNDEQQEPKAEREEPEIDPCITSAAWAASATFTNFQPSDYQGVGDRFPLWSKADQLLIKEAASFYRRWPDSTPEAVCIHLRRHGATELPVPDRRTSAAWAVFAFTLRTLDQVTAAEKAEAEAEAHAEEKRRLLVDRDRLAMTPEDDSPLSEYGKAAMRRRESPQGEKPRNDQE